MARPDLAAGADAVTVLQPDVEHGDVGIDRRDAPHGLVLGGRLADDHEVGFRFQQVANAATHDLVVVEQEDPYLVGHRRPSFHPQRPTDRALRPYFPRLREPDDGGVQ